MHRKWILAATTAITGLLADSSCASATVYTFTTLDVLGAANTRAFGINDRGQIVGFFNTSAEGHGFLYSGGSFTSIDPPGALGRSSASGINHTGEIVGSS